LPFPAAQPGDPDKPLAKAIWIAQVLQFLVRPQKDILGKILSIGKIARVIVADRPYQRRVTVVEHFIGCLLSVKHGLNERLVAWFRQIGALTY
jgi:hypothetical protein